MKMDTYPGQSIQAACSAAVGLAKENNCNVTFVFNGQDMTATPGSDPAAMAKAYSDECERRHAEYLASPEYKEAQENLARARREREAKVNELLAGAPAEMSVKDAAAWKEFREKNTDPYGDAVGTYAERWARLMEARMAKGEKLEAIADECSHLADLEGISGFMYGCAVGTLSRVWIYGEELRRWRWHNLHSQIGNEGEKANESGGVLNPALLTIGQKGEANEP